MSGSHRGGICVPIVLLCAVLAACGGSREPEPAETFEELETVDVGEAIDAGLTTGEDRVGPPREDPEIAGALPGGFPGDVPLFKPSSIVDFGELGDGRYYLELDTSAPPGVVSADLDSRLAGFGWAAESGSVGGGAGTFTKGGRTLGINLRDLSPGSRIRYEY